MAAIRGITGPRVDPSTLAWPAGTIAGDLAILWDAVGSRPPGWASITGETRAYSKRLTSADIAAALPVTGHVGALFTLSAAGGVGRVCESEWCRVQAGGVGIWLAWKSPHSSSALASATYQYGSTVTASDDGYSHAVYARAVTSTDYYSPGSVDDRTHMVSIEILPTAAPSAPIWVVPTSGTSVDRTQVTEVSVSHQSASNAAQDKLRVEIRVAAGTWQHVDAAGAIVASPQELVQAGGLVQIATNQLAANTTYELRAVTHDDGGWSSYSASITLIARTRPTAVVTLTTTVGDVSPTVSVALTPGVGSETSWEACVAPAGAGPDAALAGWSSGLQRGSDTSWQASPSTEPVNGGSYVGWWRYTDGALRSAWTASTAQTVSWTAPPAPATCVATDGTPPTITASGINALSLALEWQWLVGGVWTALTSTEGPASTVAIRVPQAPYGVERTYRVRALASVDGVRLPSAWTTSAAMTSTDRGAYIISEDGTEWVKVRLAGAGAMQPIQGYSASPGLGATRERVDRTPIAGYRSWWTVRTLTLADERAMISWLTDVDRPRIRLRPPPERPFWGTATDVPSLLVAVRDVPETDRIAQANISPRTVNFSWTTQGV